MMPSNRHRARKSVGGPGSAKTIPATESAESQVVEFYNGRCVLLTGASGFVGKLVLEKLLRTCTGVRKIFVLMRSKKNKTARERLEAMFDSVIFSTLKETCASASNGCTSSFEELKRKVVLVQGELTKPFLGLSIERLLQLADECSVILHTAAIVSFEGKLRQIVDTNLRGTHHLLQLATKLPKLRAIVHVSTCYSNCTQSEVGEHIYPVNIDPRTLIEIMDSLDDEILDRTLAPKLMGEHPNLYTYTKQLAEYLCGQFVCGEHQLPIVICRPSIIISTYEEPLKAFVDNRNAGNGMFDGVSRGLMRTVQGRESTIMDQVPADFVVNCTIALGWFCDLYQRIRLRIEAPRLVINDKDDSVRIENKELEGRMLEFYKHRKKALRVSAIKLGIEPKMIQLPVFHMSSGEENPITFYEMFKKIAKYSLEYPSSELFREPKCAMHESALVNKVDTFVQNTLVGKFMDLMCRAPKQQVGKRSSTWSREFQRINKFNSVLPHFYLNSFEFYTENRVKLIDEFMNAKDRQLFNCDMRPLDWDSFARDITLGIRRYLIGEPESTLPEARVRLSANLLRNSVLQLVFTTLIGCLVLWLFIGW